ncbi:MAG: RNA polymerase sigma factor [Nannocystaceae bacterium]|nr:sigma-70 family RNA polymerase sigma factor [bacterium]
MASDDMELLHRWRDGDETAGQTLFERHFDAVYGFFCNKVGPEAVDDLVQETFLGIVRSRDRFREEATFRTYLFAIAHRQMMKYRERWYKTRDRGADFDLERVQALDGSPSQLVIGHSEQALLVRALRHIPLELQIILELFYWQDLRSLDIAEILDIPHGTVRSRIRRAREQLAERIDQLADDPKLCASTVGNIEDWLRSLQVRAAAQASPP